MNRAGAGLMLAVCAILLAQQSSLAPTAPARLEAVRQARLRFSAERKELPAEGLYQDFRAALDVHAMDATGECSRCEEARQAAKALGIRVIGIAGPPGVKPEAWRRVSAGFDGGILFLAGTEDAKGILRFPHASIPLTFLTRPGEPSSADDWAGIEVHERHSVQATLPAELARGYPVESYAALDADRPAPFAQWDAANEKRPRTLIAASGAAANQPYEVTFRHAVTHILARELDQTQIRQSLRDGHAYVAHDWLADPTGFSFQAGNNLGVVDMGDSLYLVGTTRMLARTPLEAKLRLYRNGRLIEERTASKLDFTAKEAGAYRLEAWLTVDGEDRPWIYSNPIYIKPPDLSLLRLPSNDLDPSVEARRDISYLDGPPEDAAKHKLDLYLPRGEKDFPLLFFVHGGSWRFGDRAQYPPLGNRFAKAGIGVAAISYRLAPKNRHPAQIEDVAAAFRWVYDHIGEYGGRRDRIFAAGHSAGAHLVSLLALDPRYLAARNLNPRDIRGVVAMSGMYEIRAFENVFGDDPEVRRQASPFSQVRSGAPPFLITFSQWDYLLLAFQARRFHHALAAAGVPAELVYVPGEGHISEMVHIVNDDDLTARSILKFIAAQGAPL